LKRNCADCFVRVEDRDVRSERPLAIFQDAFDVVPLPPFLPGRRVSFDACVSTHC